MNEYHEADTADLIIHLNESKFQFDQKMKKCKNFEEVKKLYMEIKELESHLNVINWQDQKS